MVEAIDRLLRRAENLQLAPINGKKLFVVEAVDRNSVGQKNCTTNGKKAFWLKECSVGQKICS